MSVLRFLLRMLRPGAEDDGGEERRTEDSETHRSPSSTGGPESNRSEPTSESRKRDDSVEIPADVSAHLRRFERSSGVGRTRLGFELVARAGREPSAFDPHVEHLVEMLGSEGDTSGIAAAVLGLVGKRDADRLVPHHEELLDALDHEDDTTREHVGDVLCLLAREATMPVESLVDRLETAESGRREAALVLGVVAATRPDTIPTERLVALRDRDDVVTRGCAGYVLAVYSGETTADVVPTTEDAYVDLVHEIWEAEVNGFVQFELMEPAIRFVVERTVPEVRCYRVDRARTQMGTQLVLHVDRPDVVARELAAGDDREGLETALEESLGLTDPQIDVKEYDESDE